MRLKSVSLLSLGVCGFSMMAWAASTSTPGTYLVEEKCPQGSYCPGDGQKYICPENSNCGASSTEITCATGFILTNGKCVATQTCPGDSLAQCPEHFIPKLYKTLTDGTKCYFCTECETGYTWKDGQCVVSTCSQAEQWRIELSAILFRAKSTYSTIKEMYLDLKKDADAFALQHGKYPVYDIVKSGYTEATQIYGKLDAAYKTDLTAIDQKCEESDNLTGFAYKLEKISSTMSDTIVKEKDDFICDVNYYLSVGEQIQCLACPTGTVTNGKTGAQSKSDCVANITCKSTQYYNGTKCVSCPSNATCTGVDFICKDRYYKMGSYCKSCPTGAASCTSATDFVCKTGYYNAGTKCEACPSYSASCTSKTDFVCKDGYYKYGITCRRMPTCSQKQYLYSTVNKVGTLYSCRTCPTGATCDGKTATCPENSTLKNGKCVVNNYKA